MLQQVDDGLRNVLRRLWVAKGREWFSPLVEKTTSNGQWTR